VSDSRRPQAGGGVDVAGRVDGPAVQRVEFPMTMRSTRLLIAIVASLSLCWLGGCGPGPKAPALRDSAVYQNNREGFRFLVPDGWLQSANAQLPEEDLEGEVLLVQYKMRTPGMGASVEVLCFDEDQPSDLHQYHAGPSHGTTRWKSAQPAEDLEINGTSSQRFVYTAKISGKEMTKEVAAFRRGKRVYSFIGLFWSSDDNAREQLRRAVNSIIWRD
jgi:hypothetical protein